jgi:hypothetical protein
VDCLTLVDDQRRGRLPCRSYSSMQMGSRNRPRQSSALAGEEKKGIARARRQDFNLWTQVHQRYPTGDVVVSEHDLAEQLRKRPDTVATALKTSLGRTKSPEKRAERVLEAKRVISSCGASWLTDFLL